MRWSLHGIPVLDGVVKVFDESLLRVASFLVLHERNNQYRRIKWEGTAYWSVSDGTYDDILSRPNELIPVGDVQWVLVAVCEEVFTGARYVAACFEGNRDACADVPWPTTNLPTMR